MKSFKRLLVAILSAAMIFSSMATAFAADFTDISGMPYEQSVKVLQSLGVVVGKDDGTYGYADNVKRSEMAVILVRLAGYASDYDAEKDQPAVFSDCTDNAMKGWINVAYNRGLVKGVGDGKYNPDGDVTYAEVVTMLMKLLGYTSVADNSDVAWPYNYLNEASKIKLNDGITFASNKAAIRGDIAKLAENTLYQNKLTAFAYNNGNPVTTYGPTVLEDVYDGSVFDATVSDNAISLGEVENDINYVKFDNGEGYDLSANLGITDTVDLIGLKYHVVTSKDKVVLLQQITPSIYNGFYTMDLVNSDITVDASGNGSFNGMNFTDETKTGTKVTFDANTKVLLNYKWLSLSDITSLPTTIGKASNDVADYVKVRAVAKDNANKADYLIIDKMAKGVGNLSNCSGVDNLKTSDSTGEVYGSVTLKDGTFKDYPTHLQQMQNGTFKLVIKLNGQMSSMSELVNVQDTDRGLYLVRYQTSPDYVYYEATSVTSKDNAYHGTVVSASDYNIRPDAKSLSAKITLSNNVSYRVASNAISITQTYPWYNNGGTYYFPVVGYGKAINSATVLQYFFTKTGNFIFNKCGQIVMAQVETVKLDSGLGAGIITKFDTTTAFPYTLTVVDFKGVEQNIPVDASYTMFLTTNLKGITVGQIIRYQLNDKGYLDCNNSKIVGSQMTIGGSTKAIDTASDIKDKVYSYPVDSQTYTYFMKSADDKSYVQVDYATLKQYADVLNTGIFDNNTADPADDIPVGPSFYYVGTKYGGPDPVKFSPDSMTGTIYGAQSVFFFDFPLVPRVPQQGVILDAATPSYYGQRTVTLCTMDRDSVTYSIHDDDVQSWAIIADSFNARGKLIKYYVEDNGIYAHLIGDGVYEASLMPDAKGKVNVYQVSSVDRNSSSVLLKQYDAATNKFIDTGLRLSISDATNLIGFEQDAQGKLYKNPDVMNVLGGYVYIAPTWIVNTSIIKQVEMLPQDLFDTWSVSNAKYYWDATKGATLAYANFNKLVGVGADGKPVVDANKNIVSPAYHGEIYVPTQVTDPNDATKKITIYVKTDVTTSPYYQADPTKTNPYDFFLKS